MNKNSQATQEALSYTSYLALDELLNAQRPRSAEHDAIASDRRPAARCTPVTMYLAW